MVSGYSGLLTATVFLPVAGAVVIFLLLRGDRNIRFFAVMVALADLVLSLVVFSLFEQGDGAERFQLVDRFAWIPGGEPPGQFLHGGGWTKRAAGRPHRNPGILRGPFLLAHRPPGERVLHLAADSSGCGHGSVRHLGPAAVLPLLGAGTGAHVHAHLHLGYRAQRNTRP